MLYLSIQFTPNKETSIKRTISTLGSLMPLKFKLHFTVIPQYDIVITNIVFFVSLKIHYNYNTQCVMVVWLRTVSLELFFVVVIMDLEGYNVCYNNILYVALESPGPMAGSTLRTTT